MKPETIRRIIPKADPEFVRIMASLPDMPAGSQDRLAELLPKLHKIFLKKKAAAKKGDKVLFASLTEEEVALIKQADWR